MSDPHNLSTDALVRKVLADDHADFAREAVSFLCHQIMEAEVSAHIGAGLGERSPSDRLTQRNGYRERRWDTRTGSLERFIPKLRSGSYFPSFLEPRRRRPAPARRGCGGGGRERDTRRRCRRRALRQPARRGSGSSTPDPDNLMDSVLACVPGSAEGSAGDGRGRQAAPRTAPHWTTDGPQWG